MHKEYFCGKNKFFEALREPPVFGTIFRKDGWDPQYLRDLKRGKEVCLRHGICDHSFEHAYHAGKNALTLGKIVSEQVKNGTRGLLPSKTWPDFLSSGSLLFVALQADRGYGHPDAVVVNRSIPEHTLWSARGIDAYQEHPLVQEHNDMFRQAIEMDLYTSLEYAKRLQRQDEPITPVQLFPLIPKVGDVFDYFRSGRVSHLSEADNKDNPYFYLAAAVDKYAIVSDEDRLVYQVRLKKDSRADFPTWFAESNRDIEGDRNYGNVWELGNVFAKLIGKELAVEEMPTVFA